MPAAYEPIEPEELERLQTIFETARYIACMSRHDPAADERSATAWISGHTHFAYRATRGSTLLLSNPHGYPDERLGFDPLLTIEV